MQIVPLREEHLEDAARLFVASYRAQRARNPVLPPRHEDPLPVAEQLSALARRAPGVAALRDGRLCGYVIGFPIDAFQGSGRGVLSTIYAHAAVGDDRAAIYRHLYERIAAAWGEAGCLTHAFTLYADDAVAQDVFFRNGFGLLVVDALRSLEPVAPAPGAGIAIRQATAADVELVLPLAEALSRHVASAPVFLPLLELPSRAEWETWLAEPDHRLWLALHEGEAVAYLRSQPPQFDVAYVVRDPGTISITGAYTRPEWRGEGIGAALLAALVEWARASGYERCSVDFESTNLLGSRFWLRHFQPVCHSVIRRVDERIAWAHAGRRVEALW